MNSRMLFILALSILAAVPVVAGDIGFASGENCTVTGNVVTCIPDGGRGSLVVTASLSSFVELRDALTPTWDPAVGLTCQRRHVREGLCTEGQLGTQLTANRADAALIELSFELRRIVRDERRREDVEAASTARDAATAEDLGG